MRDRYFEWLYDIACGDRFAKTISYKQLLLYLYGTDFEYYIPRDENRAEDGICMRERYEVETGRICTKDGECSVLEMMVGLAVRCEENIMDDPAIGDRTSQWFWAMMVSLGLGSMSDERFIFEEAEYKIDRFLRREYMPDGRGGLFTIRGCDQDLTEVEIWYQLCWYLDSVSGLNGGRGQ